MTLEMCFKLIIIVMLYLFNCVRCMNRNLQNNGRLNSSSLLFIEAFHLRVCGTKSSCNKELKVNISELTNVYNLYKSQILFPEHEEYMEIYHSRCSTCSCDLHNCIKYGACCVDILNTEIIESEEYSTLSCSLSQLRQQGGYFPSGRTVWMVNTCADRFDLLGDANKTVIQDKCEHPEMYLTLDVVIPVSDIHSSLTYQNRFCMICNNVSDTQAINWRASIECVHAEDALFLQKMNHNKSLFGEIKKTRTCNIIYNAPKESKFLPSHCSKSDIASCNVTGKWKSYNSFIETACHAYTSQYTCGRIYKNVFCYMCNENYWPIGCTMGYKPSLFPLFSTLLKYNPTEYIDPEPIKPVSAMCTRSQILDTVKNVCRLISCRFPKKEEKGKCVNMVDSVAGLKFILYLTFIPHNYMLESDFSGISKPLIGYVQDKLLAWALYENIYNFTLSYRVSYIDVSKVTADNLDGKSVEPWKSPGSAKEYVLNKASSINDQSQHHSNNNESHSTETILTHFDNKSLPFVHIPPESNLPLQSSEIAVQSGDHRHIVNYFTFRIGIYLSAKGKQMNVSFLDGILSEDDDNVTIVNSNTEQSESFRLKLSDFSSSDFSNDSGVIIEDPRDSTMLTNYPVQVPVVKTEDKSEPIVIVQHLVCPLVDVGIIDNNIVTLANGSLFIYTQNVGLRYAYIADTELENGTSISKVFVCVDTFKQLLEKSTVILTPVTKSSTVPTIKEIFSLLCSCVSIVCAFSTFVTYCLFKEMRTQPGLNNMLLVFNLILAQTLFQFGVNQADNIPDWACKAIGLLVHFFWLNVIFWLNVCSFHLFKVFTTLQQLKPKGRENKLKTTSVYCIYCILVSLAFVAINVAVTCTVSVNLDFGYGGLICYISRLDMMGYVFGLPVCLVIIVNISLFVIMIVKISRLPRVPSSTKSDRNFFVIYTKLASVTGLTWITGFVYYFTVIDVFEYIFIFFNAGQGLFIFVSFICNKRVLDMYKRLLCRKELVQTEDQTSETKQTALPVSSSSANNTVV